MRRVVILGGTGMFGRRLARHLSLHAPPMDLIVTSRSMSRARAFAGEIGATGAALDTAGDFAEGIAALAPFAVVDCSGPFQSADHRAAAAVVGCGAHMVDLADARSYLLDYRAALDDLALRHGVTALAGASSTPALSGAVARALTGEWSRVERLDFAITPGGRSEVGPAVLQATTGYAGRDVPVWRDGRQGRVKGWTGGVCAEMPGLGRRRVAPVETADAELLGSALRVTGDITFRAGLESPVEQRGLEAIAALRRRGWLSDLRWMQPALLAARRVTRLTTSDRGGMAVRAAGRDGEGRPVEACWSLVATHDDGPQVPTLAAAASIRALLDDGLPSGARICDLPLDAIMAEAAPYRIAAQTIQTRA